MDFRKRFPLALWRPDVDDEVDSEFEFHLEMRRRELVARGFTEAQAREAALERFGDLPRARRECRAIGRQREKQMRFLQFLAELRQDVAFAFRQMLRNPAFTLMALVTLALGIAATTAIFSAVHAVVLRPLPVPEPERLVEVNEGWRDSPPSRVSVSVFQDIAAESQAFEVAAALQYNSYALARESGAERLIGARVTGRYFDVFGIRPALGRAFGPAEDVPGREQVVVLSHRLWRQFGADASIVGRELLLDQVPHTVVGVMPPAFDFTADGPALWVPAAFTPAQIAHRDEHYLIVTARLREGVSLRQAGARLHGIMTRRMQFYPDEDKGRWLRARPFMEPFVGDYRERLFVLLAAVGCVLLIACGNALNLLLARGAARNREFAVRSALGAGQGRLVRQLLTESLVLGLASAAAGVLLARWLLGLLVAFAPEGVPRLEQASIDLAALGFAAALAVASTIVFGLVPAIRASRTDVNSTLKLAARGAGSRAPRDLVRSTLIAAEVALALVLLVGAGLLVRTALETSRVAPGFDPEGVLSGRLVLPELRYKEPPALLADSERIETAVAAIPGVTTAAVGSTVPGHRTFSNGLLPEGAPLELKYVTQSDGVFVSPAYFRTLGLRILRGRNFDARDHAESTPVVILNETAAHQMWPGQDAIGKRLTSASPRGVTTVVGIVSDVRAGGPLEDAPPMFYVPFSQLEETAWGWTRRSFFVVARTDGDPASLGPTIRRVLAGVDPSMPFFDVMTMEKRMAETVDTARFNTMLLSALGLVGLLLAGVGIYAVIAYFAAQRTSEIGIRMALGASRADVVRMVVRQAAVPVLAGVLVGMLGASYASKAIATQLVNVQPTDPATFAAVAAAILLVGLVAALIPARRAAALDPTQALQVE